MLTELLQVLTAFRSHATLVIRVTLSTLIVIFSRSGRPFSVQEPRKTHWTLPVKHQKTYKRESHYITEFCVGDVMTLPSSLGSLFSSNRKILDSQQVSETSSLLTSSLCQLKRRCNVDIVFFTRFPCPGVLVNAGLNQRVNQQQLLKQPQAISEDIIIIVTIIL